MKKLTNKQLKELTLKPRDLARAIHSLCPKTNSGQHYKRTLFDEVVCKYCQRRLQK